MNLRFFLLFGFLLFAVPVYAASHRDELKKVQSDIDSQKAKQADLGKQQEDIEKKVGALQKQLIKLSKEMHEHEQKVLSLHDEEAKTEAQIKDATDGLQKQRKSLATTIMALMRLNQMPPQAVLARPSAPIDMARSFDLLQKIIPAVSKQAEEIKLVVKNLQDLHEKQAEQEVALKQEQDQLDDQQKQVEATVRERKELLAQNKAQQKDIADKVASLSNRAKDLQDLVREIDEESKHRTKTKKAKEQPVEQASAKEEAQEGKPDIMKSVRTIFDNVVMNFGSFRLPVTGHIATNFGDSTSQGVTAQGMTIAARPGTVVTAPAGGVIRFAGPFRQYKLLVIIQHPNGDHSLIGGMQALYTEVGARVAGGEPIGKLPESDKFTGDSTTSASLYYERRRDGKPIDPRTARG